MSSDTSSWIALAKPTFVSVAHRAVALDGLQGVWGHAAELPSNTGPMCVLLVRFAPRNSAHVAREQRLQPEESHTVVSFTRQDGIEVVFRARVASHEFSDDGLHDLQLVIEPRDYLRVAQQTCPL